MTLPEPIEIECDNAYLCMCEYNNLSRGTILLIETGDRRIDSLFEIELSPKNVGDMIEYLEYVRDKCLE